MTKQLLFPLIVNSFICFAGIRYSDSLFGKKLVRNSVFFSIAALCVVFFTVMNNINATAANFDFTSASLIIFILMFFYPVRLRFKLLMSILFVAMASVSQMFSVMLIAYLTKSDILGTKSLVITISVAVVAFLLLCEIIAKIKGKYQDDTEISKLIFFAAIPVTSIVLVSGHDLTDVTEISDRVVMIDGGKKVYDDIFDGDKRYCLILSPDTLPGVLQDLPVVTTGQLAINNCTIEFKEIADLKHIMQYLLNKNIAVTDMQIKENFGVFQIRFTDA